MSHVRQFEGRNQTLINMSAEGKQREGFHSAGEEQARGKARPAGGMASGHHAGRLAVCTGVLFPSPSLFLPLLLPLCFLCVDGQNPERVTENWGRREDSIPSTLRAEVQHKYTPSALLTHNPWNTGSSVLSAGTRSRRGPRGPSSARTVRTLRSRM